MIRGRFSYPFSVWFCSLESLGTSGNVNPNLFLPDEEVSWIGIFFSDEKNWWDGIGKRKCVDVAGIWAASESENENKMNEKWEYFFNQQNKRFRKNWQIDRQMGLERYTQCEWILLIVCDRCLCKTVDNSFAWAIIRLSQNRVEGAKLFTKARIRTWWGGQEQPI